MMDQIVANECLVSIVVITYNSSKYVIETLESAKLQTYNHLQLIVSDDGSTDNTVEICKNWISNNSSRFSSAEVVTTPVNTGIPANCNRALKKTKGSWIKLIAGDDILVQDCITNYLNQLSFSNAKLFFSKMSDLKDGIVIETETTPAVKNFFTKNVKEKYKEFIRHAYFLNSPSIFIHVETLNRIGGFDEKYKYLEDLPLILKFLKHSEDICFLEKVTVLHRIHEESLASVSTSISPFRQEFRRNLYESYRELRRPYLSWFNIVDVYAIINTDMNLHREKRPTVVVRSLFALLLMASRVKRLFKTV